MSSVLSIDQSTSATKAVVFDTAGGVRGLCTHPHAQIYPRPGWVEHDAEEIWQNTVEAVGDVVADSATGATDLACISITNQRETIVVFDRVTGRPLHNAIVWQCRRGEAICRAIDGGGHAATIRRKTGLTVDPYFSGSKLAWLVAERPDLAARLAAGDALVGTIDTYLVYRLTGGRVFATDHTNASRTLLYDVTRLSWDEELCRLFRIPLRALPEVRESSAQFGSTTVEGRLPSPVPIRGVMGDSQASMFAQGCFEPGMTKATFGSGTSVMLNIGDRFRVTEGGAVTALAWVMEGRPTYALEGIITSSASTIEWLRTQLGLIADAADSEALAESVPDSGGAYLVPAFAGLGAPHWRSDARAAILGMSAHTSRAHVVRAALESVAYQVRDVLDMMGTATGVTPSRLLVDGGATANRFLVQFMADICGLAIDVSTVSDLSALGAAWSGMLGAGLHPSIEALAALPRDRTHYTPRMPPAEAAGLHAGWMDAVRRVL